MRIPLAALAAVIFFHGHFACAGYFLPTNTCSSHGQTNCQATAAVTYSDWLATWPRTIANASGCDLDHAGQQYILNSSTLSGATVTFTYHGSWQGGQTASGVESFSTCAMPNENLGPPPDKCQLNE